ncbi:MAG: hypothetical protein A2015_07835 [Spirochaetes bacterium GWF1_31_7]|nr:MAG: hypothetical protein A2Y30_01925 [Spirochaetes bacterium GWE1_32_154]OHD46951.1 MAG: hypothetical protein A2015_07835 [Spirochaetes bacterium GWF1_31_7]OHD48729.1 MAG: hypothetical protein A2Y29_14060 [Spirochaetes bacterium GWE2_31_10]
MRVALFNHPFNDFYKSPSRMSSGILSYLAHMIGNYESICFDVVKHIVTPIDLPDELSYIAPHICDDITDYSFFRSYFRFGAVHNFNHKDFKVFSPDVILITTFAFCYADGLKDQIEYLRKLSGAVIIIGGSGVSSNPQWYIENVRSDFCVVGPAEIVLPELIERINRGVGTEDLVNVFSSAHMCKVDLNKNYNFKPYYSFNKRNKTLQLQLTRGCPKKCQYCSIGLTAGNKFRKSNPDDIENVFKLFPTIKRVDFEDDNLSCDSKYFFNVLDIVRKYCPDALISFENGIDFTTLTDDVLERLQNYTILQYNISFTSAENSILDTHHRGYTVDQFEVSIRKIIKTGKPVIVYFIAGLPGDTAGNIFNTIKYLFSLDVIIGISPFYAVPGTKVIENIKESNKPFMTSAMSFNGYGVISELEKITFFMLTRFINAMKKSNKNEFTVLGLKKSIEEKKIIGILNDGSTFEYQLDSGLVKQFFDEIIGGVLYE